MLHVLLLGLLVVQASPTAPPTPPVLSVPSASPSPAPEPEATAQPEPVLTPTPSPVPSGPRLTVSSNAVDLNPAQQRTISVSGASAPLTATLDGKLVTVTVDPSASSVTVAATQATGSDVLHLTDANGARADIAIRVAFNAGTIVPQTTLKVTGNPIDPGWLLRQVTSWVQRITLAQPGTQTTFGSVAAPDVAPAPGAQTQVTVPVTISSNGNFFDQSGTTVVDVQNVALDPFKPALLFYDDDPEHVARDGVLFRQNAIAGQPVRLYYYHDDAADPRRVVVLLSSASQDPTSVQVIDASAGPNADVMQVGHAVSRDFLLTKSRGQGLVIDLPQDAPFVLHDVAMTSRQGVAGNLDVRVLDGGPVAITVLAVSPGVDPRSLADGALLPDDGHHRTGVFRLAGFGSDALSYAAGGPDAKVVIGDREPTPPSSDPSAPGHDYGDYGVLHDVTLSLSNPGDTPVTAYLYFRPIAGIARATFLVDGSLVQLGCVRLPVPYQISAFSLAPHQTSQATVQTMTDGGSFYPVEIGVTSTPPAPVAPPITAADGCFPKPLASPQPAGPVPPPMRSASDQRALQT
jgi:hypothetical protein